MPIERFHQLFVLGARFCKACKLRTRANHAHERHRRMFFRGDDEVGVLEENFNDWGWNGPMLQEAGV